jgi:Leucine-rich repeat (LRR) protein
LSTPPPTSDKETSPLAHLEYLVVLDMNGVPLLELSKQDGSNKSNLHYLDLSGSKFTTLPTEFFCEMASLEELILSNCTNLKELPPSMAELSNLLVLHVGGTQITSFPEDMFQAMQKLHTLKLTNNILLMLLPRSLSEAKGLKELHLSNCISLRLELIWELVPCLEDLYIETWKSVEGIKIHGHPNLRMFSLSGKWIRCLSLCGCSKLKIVNFSDDLTDLKDVDLSGTALEEVPHNYLISRRIPSDMILIISQLFLYTPLLINAPQNCVRKRKM